MKIKINPTRQELLELKKRLKKARIGHKLLEDKLENLVQGFLKKIKETKELQNKIKKELPDIFLNFLRKKNILGEKETKNFLRNFPKIKIDTTEKNIFGVNVKEFEVTNKEEILGKNLSSFSPDCFLKKNHEKFKSILEDLIKYASLEQEIKSIANEIISTKRRVNALEHVFIPEMERTQKYISQKLEEQERFERSLLIKLKNKITS